MGTLPEGSFYEYPPRLYSGRYSYNMITIGTSLLSQFTNKLHQTTLVPIYPIKTPFYSDKDSKVKISWDQLRFNLLIDIDGPDYLNAVSGSVIRNFRCEEFIGCVTSAVVEGYGDVIGYEGTDPTGYRLTVEKFAFLWPGSDTEVEWITKLDIHLYVPAGIAPAAEVFFCSTSNRYGPYVADRSSAYFREITIEVDLESDAEKVEPYKMDAHLDRPDNTPTRELSLTTAYAKAGISVMRPAGDESVIDTSTDYGATWSQDELHDAMEIHWSEYSTVPQWKMWVLIAKKHDDGNMMGLMFDSSYRLDPYDDELTQEHPDRQGCAVFTKSDTLQNIAKDNPPPTEAIQRQLFFTLIHEVGHAFNLAHSFSKDRFYWDAPWWAPAYAGEIENVPGASKALSWMNYPWTASRAMDNHKSFNETWFFERFRFAFEKSELFFLRHAPERFVQPGNMDFLINHALVAEESLDPQLSLTAIPVKRVYELGENVLIDLKLSNIGDKSKQVNTVLHPSAGSVSIAIVTPCGKRVPFVPIWKALTWGETKLEPHDFVSDRVNLTFGRLGFPFKEPGPYRIDVSYRNADGLTAAAVLQIFVSPPKDWNLMPVISELFDPSVGKVSVIGGTRRDDINEKLDWIRNQLGSSHPAWAYLTTIRFLPFAKAYKWIDLLKKKVILLEPDYDIIMRDLDTVEYLKKRPKLVETFKSRNILKIVRELGKNITR